MPFLLPLLSNWRVWLGIAFLLLAGYAQYQKSEARAYKDKLAVFTAQVESIGKQAIERNRRIEDANKSRIDVAIANRDASIARLRVLVQQARSGSGAMPIVPAPAAAGGSICYDQSAVSAAVERYRQRVIGIVESGDEAQIDANFLLKAWPKQ